MTHNNNKRLRYVEKTRQAPTGACAIISAFWLADDYSCDSVQNRRAILTVLFANSCIDRMQCITHAKYAHITHAPYISNV